MVSSREKRSIRALIKSLPIKLLLIAGLFVAAIFLFALITHQVVFQKEDLFDSKVSQFFSPYSKEPFIGLMKFFTFFGSSKFLLPGYAALIIFYVIKGKTTHAINIAIIGITSTALSFGSKRIFQRARPDLPLIQSLKTYSFPSGHALSSFIFCSILIFLVWRANIQLVWKWVFSLFLFLFSLTIGISRIVLKMHYPTDVVAGFCLGFVWVILSFYILARKKQQQPALIPKEVSP